MQNKYCPNCGAPLDKPGSLCRDCLGIGEPSNKAEDAKRIRRSAGGMPRWLRRLLRGSVIILLPFVLVGGALFVAITTENKRSQAQSAEYEAKKAERIAGEEATRAEIEERRLASSEEEAECKADWQCWAERHSLRAILSCQPQIENQAKYDFRWTDSWLQPKFSRVSATEKKNIFVYSGDSLQLQNGFGAWENHIYRCRYNVEAENVDFVEVKPGRL